ncbi:hypothetical protein CPB84DRAFT_1769032, partial [Gymnopilus junonius]
MERALPPTTMTSNEASDYLVSQTRDNISLLLLLGRISSGDARDILAKIPAVKSPLSRVDPTAGFDRPPSRTVVGNLARPSPIPNPNNYVFKAKAIWGYNEDRREPNDLTFAAGDVIEVIDDRDSSWWKGSIYGSEGLFPSTYVEKLLPAIPSTPKPIPNRNSSYYPEKIPLPNYQTAPYHPPSPYPYPQQQNTYFNPPGPPPPNAYPQYQPPAQGQPPPTVVAPADAQQQTGGKKHKIFGGSLGSTLAHSAAGGVGFGAGSAIASDLVNSIF